MQVQAKTSQVLTLDVSRSETELRLADGRAERLRFTLDRPTEFTMREPIVKANGDARIELEILQISLSATSQVLWPGETVRVSGGVAANGTPLHATVHIPAGKSLADGVMAEQLLYWRMETPIGVLRNEKPIHMVGVVRQIPPYGSEFSSTEEISLINEAGEVVGTLWDCLQVG